MYATAASSLAGLFAVARLGGAPSTVQGILVIAVGLALRGFKPVVEMQYADFITCGFNQIVNRSLAFSLAADAPLWLAALAATIGAGVLAGSYGAVVLSRFSPEAVSATGQRARMCMRAAHP